MEKNFSKEETTSDSEETKKVSKKKSKRPLWQWLAGIVAVVVGLLVWQYFAYQNKVQAQRAAQVKQEEVLVQHWTEQGLSQEEIQTKLRETRQEAFNPEDAPLVFQLMRTFRHATGTGPGAGGQPGSFPPPEGGMGPRDGSGMGMGGGSRR